MHVTSEPSGALVYMNDREIGRTPLRTDFTWYGTYDVQVRADGHETLRTQTRVIAPWWQWPPFDLFAELLPWRARDTRRIHYLLDPSAPAEDDAQALIERGTALRGRLESSRHAPAATRPAP